MNHGSLQVLADRYLERRFAIRARGSSPGREIVGGGTTYMTLAYIVFVQPVVLSAAGMDFGAALSATCVASAIACFVMGLAANYPIALAPAMGHNFFFAYTVVLAMGVTWQAALGTTFVAGVLFFALSLGGIRERIIDGLPASLLNAIACGIGLLIALIGLEWGGIVVGTPGTFVGLGDLTAAPALLALSGLLITSGLLVRRVRGAILIGILCTTALGLGSGLVQFHGILAAPPSLAPTAFQLDLRAVFSVDMLVVVAIFLFLDVFDTIGTLVGVAPEAGLMRDGKLVGGRNALLADATGTVVGSLLGTSTVTSYVESAAGIQSGARTGLAAVTTGLLLLVTPVFHPLVQMIGGGLAAGDVTLYPITAAPLIIVGVMMMRPVVKIDWADPGEAVPAFLTIIVMPLAVSITDGIAFGLISYSVLSFIRGRPRDLSVPVHVCALLLLLRYAFLT